MARADRPWIKRDMTYYAELGNGYTCTVFKKSRLDARWRYLIGRKTKDMQISIEKEGLISPDGAKSACKRLVDGLDKVIKQ